MLDLNLSFRSCEHESFKTLVEYLRFEAKMLDRIKIFEMIITRVKMIKKHVLNDLDSNIKVSLALDIWTSCNHLAFMSVIEYFVNEHWRYREILLAFRSLIDSHTDVNLASEILNIMIEYHIENRLLTIIVDNASNNKILRHELVKLLRSRNISWNSHSDIVNCMTHVMQLSVNVLLKTLKVKSRNEETSVRFDEKSLRKVKNVQSFDNTIRKICLLYFNSKFYY